MALALYHPKYIQNGVTYLAITSEDTYTGWKHVKLTDDHLAQLYANPMANQCGLKINEYLIVEDKDGQVVDKLKWNGETLVKIQYKQIARDGVKIKPRNDEQALAFDLLQDNNISTKIITGIFGAGKDFCMVACALEQIRIGKADRVVFMRNNVGVKDVEKIGFLPNGMDEKLMPFYMNVADNLCGGLFQFEALLKQGVFSFEYLGFVRGRSYQNTIIISSEAENLTTAHVALMLGRVGENSQLWLNGDFAQVDSALFEKDSGLRAAIEKLAGHPLFGYVHFTKCERSKTSELAQLLLC